MAAYRRVYASRHLQADCQEPGSAPKPYTLGNRVWATLLKIRRISRKQKQRRIYIMFTFSECHVTMCHYNDKRSRDRLSFDNDQRHVSAFRPISEAAHSWSYGRKQ